MPVNRFLKYTGRNWPNPVCSFYLSVSISWDDTVCGVVTNLIHFWDIPCLNPALKHTVFLIFLVSLSHHTFRVFQNLGLIDNGL